MSLSKRSKNSLENVTQDDSEKKTKFLSGKSIFVEIVNNNVDESSLLDDLLTEAGAMLNKKLCKNLQYIIFKDGRLKTIKYALDNSIPLVNPLWLHDKLNNIFLSDEKYLIRKTFTELTIEENYKSNPKKRGESQDISATDKKRKRLKPLKIEESSKKNRHSRINSRKSMLVQSDISKFFKCDSTTSESDISHLTQLPDEVKKIKVYSYGLTPSDTNFFSTSEYFDYKGEINEKNFKKSKVIFVNSNMSIGDWKIVLFFLEKKIVINFTTIIDYLFLQSISDKITEKILTTMAIKPKKFDLKKIEKLNYCFDIDKKDFQLEEYGVIKRIILEIFHKKIKKETKGSEVLFKIAAKYQEENDNNSCTYKASIKSKYIYDSYYSGELIELTNENIKKYSI